MYSSTDTSTQVRWAGEDESEMFVPHELLTGRFDGLLYLAESVTESGEYLQMK